MSCNFLKCASGRVIAPTAGSPVQADGFSLFELLVVLAITSIFVALAVPDMRGLFSDRDLYHQADEMSSRLSRVRDLALEQGCPWRTVFNAGRGSWSSFCDRDGDSEQDPGEAVLGPFSLCRGIVFGSDAAAGPNNTSLPPDGISFQDNSITFSPMGTCNAGSIYLKSRKASLAIRVYPASGVTRIWAYRKTWENIK